MAVRNLEGLLNLRGKSQREADEQVQNSIDGIVMTINKIHNIKDDIVDFIDTYEFLESQTDKDSLDFLNDIKIGCWNSYSFSVGIKDDMVYCYRDDFTLYTDGEFVWFEFKESDDCIYKCCLNDHIKKPQLFTYNERRGCVFVYWDFYYNPESNSDKPETFDMDELDDFCWNGFNKIQDCMESFFEKINDLEK